MYLSLGEVVINEVVRVATGIVGAESKGEVAGGVVDGTAGAGP